MVTEGVATVLNILAILLLCASSAMLAVGATLVVAQGLGRHKACPYEIRRHRTELVIEQTVLPALLGEGKPDRLLANGACFVKGEEAIEPESHRLMFAPVGT